MKLLHIVATPRHHVSNTLRVSGALIQELQDKFIELDVETLNLFDEDLPAATGDIIEAKYQLMSRAEIDELKRTSWSLVENRIQQFLAADVYVITSPMWNFSIPYILKYYIDTIVQPHYMFRYTETGAVEQLVHNKKMICVTSRGGDYSAGGPMHAFDFQEPYLRAIFGFVGITDMQFINVQPMDYTPDIREAQVQAAIETAKALAASFELPQFVNA